MTQTELAKEFGIDVKTLNYLETGRRESCGVITYRKINSYMQRIAGNDFAARMWRWEEEINGTINERTSN